MEDLLLSDKDLSALRVARKTVKNPNARWSEKPGRHKQRNYDAESENGDQYRIYQRQNLDDDRDFSCGLGWVQAGGKILSLVRYNGASHRHGDIEYRCHIHRATAEALSAGRKVDSHAVVTNRYWTLEGALALLIEECQVQELTAQPDVSDLFDGA